MDIHFTLKGVVGASLDAEPIGYCQIQFWSQMEYFTCKTYRPI